MHNLNQAIESVYEHQDRLLADAARRDRAHRPNPPAPRSLLVTAAAVLHHLGERVEQAARPQRVKVLRSLAKGEIGIEGALRLI